MNPRDHASDRPDRSIARPRPADADPTLQALEELVAAADKMAQLAMRIREQAAEIRLCRQQGLPYREVVRRESRPLIAEALTYAIARFEAAGTRFRQAKAAALRQEGLTLEEIGALFGLTRQRISGLLQEGGAARAVDKRPGGVRLSGRKRDGVP